MALQATPVRSANTELNMVVFRLQGAATSALSLVEPASGAGVTVARTSEGIHTITFDDDPGNYVGSTWGLEDTTPGNVDDHIVAIDSYASKVLTFTVTDLVTGTKELQDLAATSFLTLCVFFKRTAI